MRLAASCGKPSLWKEGASNFSVDPPNAVLSFLDRDGGAPPDVVVLLAEPCLEGNELSYSVEILDGTLPARCGPCSLFIDVFGRPLIPIATPGSQAGKVA